MFDTINAGQLPDVLHVVIEIPALAPPIKYEVDKKSGCLWVDRCMPTAMFYPVNYGYVPQTLSEDGDPLDVLVATPHPLQYGSVIKARPLGILKMEDESGIDYKIMAVPTVKVCPMYQNLRELQDLPELLLQQIQHFFEHYKDLEPGKWVKVSGWGDRTEATSVILKSRDRARDNG